MIPVCVVIKRGFFPVQIITDLVKEIEPLGLSSGIICILQFLKEPDEGLDILFYNLPGQDQLAIDITDDRFL
jgi:hypothetical protein